MDLKALHYLVTVADQKSISKAAETLFMAQSSLSQFLRQYEAELGVPLFVRTPKGVLLTAAGESFIDSARQILQQYQWAKNRVLDIEALKGGKVKLGISSFRGAALIPAVLKRFHDYYPDVMVELAENDSMQLEKMISDGLLDVALLALPLSHPHVQMEPLLRDQVLLVARNDHPATQFAHRRLGDPGRSWIDFKDAAAFEFVLGAPSTMLGSIVRQQFNAAGLLPITSCGDISAPFAASLARAGLALALTYESCLVDDPNVQYYSIGPEGIYLELVLAYPSTGYRSRATQTLAKLMHEMLGDT